MKAARLWIEGPLGHETEEDNLGSTSCHAIVAMVPCIAARPQTALRFGV
jgi:hypothetical protein